jgi:hypothetical protein
MGQFHEQLLFTIRVLFVKVTVWDYDYDSHNFLGETLVDLSTAPLNNQPYLYTLLDMDDENPIRARVRQRQHRLSSMTPPIGGRSQSYTGHYAIPGSRSLMPRKVSEEAEFDLAAGCGYTRQNYQQQQHKHRSRRKNYDEFVDEFGRQVRDWSKNEGEGLLPNGYISDMDNQRGQPEYFRQYGTVDDRHRRQHRHGGNSHRHQQQQRPRSATAGQVVADYSNNKGGHHHRDRDYHQHREAPPPNGPVMNRTGTGHPREVGQGQLEDIRKYDEDRPGQQQQQQQQQQRKMTRQQQLQMQEVVGSGGGYGSDCSETLSANSAQSLQNK